MYSLVCIQMHVITYTTIKKIQKNLNIIIIHKKINSNDHFTVPGPAEMDIGFGRKIGSRKIGGSTIDIYILYFSENIFRIEIFFFNIH